jgi:hypothetical protein
MKPNPHHFPRTNLALALKRKSRVCQQCGATFLAVRNSAFFCSDLCRKRAARAMPENPRPAAIVRALQTLGLIGQVAPAYRSDPTPPTYALMVPRAVAAAEISRTFVAACVSPAEVAEALRNQGILDHLAPLPEGSDRKPGMKHRGSGICHANGPNSSTKSMTGKAGIRAKTPTDQNRVEGADR